MYVELRYARFGIGDYMHKAVVTVRLALLIIFKDDSIVGRTENIVVYVDPT